MTMKTCNYLTKLPQETTIRKVETFRNYDLITLDVPVPIADPMTVSSKTPAHIRPSRISLTITGVLPLPFISAGCSVRPAELHLTLTLFDSILLDLIEPIAFSEIARRNCISSDTVQSVFEPSISAFRAVFLKRSVSTNLKETAGSGVLDITDGTGINITATSPMGIPMGSLISWIRFPEFI